MIETEDKRRFRPVRILTMGEADFNQFVRLRNQLVTAAENFGREENLSPVLIPTMSKVMDEQLKLAHNVFDVVTVPTERLVRLCCDTMGTAQRIQLLKSDC